MTPWTTAYQALLSMEFSRQEYWSGLSFPSLGDLPNPGIEPMSLEPPALARGFFTTSPRRKQLVIYTSVVVISKKIFLQPSLTRNIGLESVCIWTSHFLSLSLSFLLHKMKR